MLTLMMIWTIPTVLATLLMWQKWRLEASSIKVETEGNGEQDEHEVDGVHDVRTKNEEENEILHNVMHIFI
jgi:hypothetical protein